MMIPLPSVPHIDAFRTLAFLAALTCLTAPAEAQSRTLDADARSRAVDAIAAMLEEHYVFPDVAEQCGVRLRADLAAGSYDAQVTTGDFAQRLTTVLQEVSGDRHLRVRPRGSVPGGALTEADAERMEQQRWHMGRNSNFGFEQILRLDDNVGYLDLRSFQPAEMGRETAVAAMNFLGNSDAVIIDLRQNGGGDPEMVQLLCSYFFDEPTHLNSLYWRATDETQEFWTLDVPGRRMADVPLFVLTSSYTFSGAEEFAYNLKCRERATLIGETTGGGAHPGDMFLVDEELSMFIPVGRAINPVTGTNWEGTGVEPDVKLRSDKAMDEAVVRARKAARERRDSRERELGRTCPTAPPRGQEIRMGTLRRPRRPTRRRAPMAPSTDLLRPSRIRLDD